MLMKYKVFVRNVNDWKLLLVDSLLISFTLISQAVRVLIKCSMCTRSVKTKDLLLLHCDIAHELLTYTWLCIWVSLPAVNIVIFLILL